MEVEDCVTVVLYGMVDVAVIVVEGYGSAVELISFSSVAEDNIRDIIEPVTSEYI